METSSIRLDLRNYEYLRTYRRDVILSIIIFQSLLCDKSTLVYLFIYLLVKERERERERERGRERERERERKLEDHVSSFIFCYGWNSPQLNMIFHVQVFLVEYIS